MTDDELISWCFQHFYGLDLSNAAMHHARVRWSPITFRLAERIVWKASSLSEPYSADVQRVIDDVGKYAEDRGR
jgi:hypothetical protein